MWSRPAKYSDAQAGPQSVERSAPPTRHPRVPGPMPRRQGFSLTREAYNSNAAVRKLTGQAAECAWSSPRRAQTINLAAGGDTTVLRQTVRE